MTLTAARPLRALARALTVAVATSLVVVGGSSGSAQAHGSVTDPPSRNYGCYERWGTQHQSPAMATQDPTCWQAWQADPSTMWNWNGLYREGVAGNHQGAIPDGQLCSGGRTQAPRYNSLDAVGAWHAVDKPQKFTLTLTDAAIHGADYLSVYITKQGVDTTKAALKWSDLELVVKTPRYAPAGKYEVDIDAGNRTGRHVVYTIWQASHLDQSYYLCSDVNFVGGNGPAPTTPAPTTPAPTTPVPTTPVATTPVATTPVATTPVATTPGTTPSVGCSASLKVTSSWSGGWTGEVTVNAGASALSGWRLNWTQPSGTTINNSWSTTLTQSGSQVTASNVSYNASVAAGRSTSFGFNATGSAPGTSPAITCLAA